MRFSRNFKRTKESSNPNFGMKFKPDFSYKFAKNFENFKSMGAKFEL